MKERNSTTSYSSVYERGVEAGRQKERDRYAELREAATECIFDLETHAKPTGRKLGALREALSQLED